jgi:hypothetical protein
MVVLLGYIKEDKLALDAGGLKFCPLLGQQPTNVGPEAQ